MNPERAAAIAAIARELRALHKRAKAAEREMLAYLIDIAAQEAEDETRHEWREGGKR